jgi:uncharacterized protein YjiS (DUF1127 family)
MSTLSLPSAKQIKVFELTSTALTSLVALWKTYAVWRARSAAKIALYQLDDRTLKDIRLHRSEIDSAVNTCMRDRTRNGPRQCACPLGTPDTQQDRQHPIMFLALPSSAAYAR